MHALALPTLGLAALALAVQEPGSEPRDAEPQERGLVQRLGGAAPGYTLFAPLRSTSTYLIDLDGEVVHEWKDDMPPGNSVYLLDDGNLLRANRVDGNPRFHGGGQGGAVKLLAPDSTVLWSYELSDGDMCHHHDVEPLPNGNVLLIAWEHKTAREAVRAGRHPELIDREGELWPDCVLEIEPTPPSGGKVVWEWHVWDHLVQDVDPGKPNYGDVAAHPELVDVNADRERPRESDAERAEELRRLRGLGYAGGDGDDDDARRRQRGADWMHTNAIDYHPELDQIVLSIRRFNEIWIIDHGTTTEQAAGHEGGRWGRGGDLLYRWGNPRMYGQGGEEDQQLFGQHDAQWIGPGLPGAGNLLLFNNGSDGRSFSTVDELAPPVDAKGRYAPADGRFGPAGPAWTYRLDEEYFSGHISGAQRLPGGTTLVCSGRQGWVGEVTSGGDVVWEYLNPFHDPNVQSRGPRPGPRDGDGPPGDRRDAGPPGDRPEGGRGDRGPPTGLFRAERYAPAHPGVKVILTTAQSAAGEDQ